MAAVCEGLAEQVHRRVAEDDEMNGRSDREWEGKEAAEQPLSPQAAQEAAKPASGNISAPRPSGDEDSPGSEYWLP